MSPSIVGIDLGTTNISVCTKNQDGEFKQYEIQQLVSKGLVSAQPVLPAFVYYPSGQDLSETEIELPWDKKPGLVSGVLARTQMERAGYRTVSSAKSWLCHQGVDRRGAILPWQSDIENKVSPLDVVTILLNHIKSSWNSHKEELGVGALEEQEIVITVPASFDPVARELTLEAAMDAGLNHVSLLEEPQAALYCWLMEREQEWREQLDVGDLILVCDVGGGTTDFSLIESLEENGSLELKRVAVGNHILLGGDNMDLALAHLLKQKLEQSGKKPDNNQMNSLIAQAREGKEKILSGKADKVDIVLAGTGSGLFKSSLKTELLKSEVETVILDGFFASCSKDTMPKVSMTGIRQTGLNYAQDPAILKHLAAFLSRQEDEVYPKIKKVLFNGSMFAAEILKSRVLDTVSQWCDHSIEELLGGDMTLAVSRGAAYYAQVSQGEGIRIRASLPCSYYIGVERAQMAIPGVDPELSMLCVAPNGMEEGTSVSADQEQFHLLCGENVEFQLFRSAFRKDEAGRQVLQSEDDFEPVTVLEKRLDGTSGEFVPVVLESRLTEVGALEIWCRTQEREPSQEWKLEFQLREE